MKRVKKDFEQIKREIEDSFLERVKNTLNEKRGYCLKNGLSPYQTNCILAGAIQALTSLVPCELELSQDNYACVSVKASTSWPPRDEDIPESAFSL